MAKRIRGLPDYWEQYLSCMLMHIAAPFLPLVLELLFSSKIEGKSLLLFIAMYALAIGITSASKLVFSLTLLTGFVYCATYGWVVKGGDPEALTGWVAVFVLAAIIIVHGLERYNRHVVDRAPFWEFSNAIESTDSQLPTAHAALPGSEAPQPHPK